MASVDPMNTRPSHTAGDEKIELVVATDQIFLQPEGMQLAFEADFLTALAGWSLAKTTYLRLIPRS